MSQNKGKSKGRWYKVGNCEWYWGSVKGNPPMVELQVGTYRAWKRGETVDTGVTYHTLKEAKAAALGKEGDDVTEQG